MGLGTHRVFAVKNNVAAGFGRRVREEHLAEARHDVGFGNVRLVPLDLPNRDGPLEPVWKQTEKPNHGEYLR